jgi:hypothetical protein
VEILDSVALGFVSKRAEAFQGETFFMSARVPILSRMISGFTRIYASGPWTPFGGPEKSFSGRI